MSAKKLGLRGDLQRPYIPTNLAAAKPGSVTFSLDAVNFKCSKR